MKITALVVKFLLDEMIMSDSIEMWLQMVLQDNEAINLNTHWRQVMHAFDEGAVNHTRTLKEDCLPRLQLFQLLLREVADVIKRHCDKVTSEIDKLEERADDPGERV